MTAFFADLDALHELVTRIGAFTSSVERLGTDIDSDVRRLHGQWSGAAADAHLRAHHRWRSSAERMRAAADQLRGVVTVAQGNYASAVSANMQMWG